MFLVNYIKEIYGAVKSALVGMRRHPGGQLEHPGEVEGRQLHQRGKAVVGHRDIVPRELQRQLQQIRCVAVVVDHQHPPARLHRQRGRRRGRGRGDLG